MTNELSGDIERHSWSGIMGRYSTNFSDELVAYSCQSTAIARLCLELLGIILDNGHLATEPQDRDCAETQTLGLQEGQEKLLEKSYTLL